MHPCEEPQRIPVRNPNDIDFCTVELMGGKSKATRLGHEREFLQGLMCPRAMWTDKGQTEVSINQRAPVYWWPLHTNCRPICFSLKHFPARCCFLTLCLIHDYLKQPSQLLFIMNFNKKHTHKYTLKNNHDA